MTSRQRVALLPVLLGLVWLGLASSPSAWASVVSLPATIRDFDDSHPDFENGIGVELALVASTLGVSGRPIYQGGAGTTTTHGAVNFDQWWQNTPGVNLEMAWTLDLVEDPLNPGTFEFSEPSFFPIDGQLLGNQGRQYNYHFTLEAEKQFTFVGGEQLSVIANDDVWIFMNGQLVIDLGGVHGQMAGSVLLDAPTATALGLTPGNVYGLHIFRAQRHTSTSSLAITVSGFAFAAGAACGDGTIDPGEGCDDGGVLPGDGCSDICVIEYGFQCAGVPSVCSSLCGDGLIASDESCDDGGTVDGDGCSALCAFETGWSCSGEPSACAAICGDGLLVGGERCDDGNTTAGDGCSTMCYFEVTLTGRLRDFNDTHADFENGIGSEAGLVDSALSPTGELVYLGGAGTVTTHGAGPFSEWYTDVPGVNLGMDLDLELPEVLLSPGRFEFDDSNFFPIDGQLLGNQGRQYNYHFTYELTLSFEYVGGEILSIRGNDDIWVFVNGVLVIDLGGVHGAVAGSAPLDAIPGLGLTLGNTYELDIFYAQRHTTNSSLRITATGFKPAAPVLVPTSPAAALWLLGGGLAAIGFLRLRWARARP